MPLRNFSYSEYVLFIYLCIANVDNDLTLEEIEVLFDKMELEHFNNSFNRLRFLTSQKSLI